MLLDSLLDLVFLVFKIKPKVELSAKAKFQKIPISCKECGEILYCLPDLTFYRLNDRSYMAVCFNPKCSCCGKLHSVTFTYGADIPYMYWGPRFRDPVNYILGKNAFIDEDKNDEKGAS